MPIINAQILAGRTRDQKRALIREPTDGAVRVRVRVLVTEIDPDHLGAGGRSKADRQETSK